jgi:hypothetical protein
MRIAPPLNLIIVTAVAMPIALLVITPAVAQTIDKANNTIEGVRDARYCEIIPIIRHGLRMVGTVYNTLGLNDCPPAIWDKIHEAAIKKRFGASMVVLNGPRRAVMDAIAMEGNTASSATVEVDGLALTTRATIVHRLSNLRTKPYRERTIERETRFVFKAAQPVFLLVRPDGARYVMQSYPEKSLSYADLPALGRRLKLPPGWRYETMTPASDLTVDARGRAIIVQDDLDDTYRKLD